MKKIVGVVALLLVVVLLGVPFLTGIKAERELQAIVNTIDNYPGYNATWAEYQRGWLFTRAQLTIGLDLGQWPAEDGEPIVLPVLPLNVDVHHGPLLWGEKFGLGWFSWRVNLTADQTEWFQQRLTLAGEGQLYDAWGHMGLLGRIEFGDELQAFSVDDEEGNRFITANGYSGTGTVGIDRTLHYSGVFRGMDIAAQDALLVLGEIAMEVSGDISRMDWDTFLYPSEFVMTLANMRIQGNDNEISMSNAVFAGEIDMPAGENWFDLIITMDVENVASQNMLVDNASLSLAYERISLNVYKAYMNMATAMSDSPGLPDTDYRQFFTPEIMREFFANNPAFAIRKISFEMPEGSLNGDFELAMQKDFVMPAQMTNPLVLIEALVLTANAKVDRSLALHLAKASARAKMGEAVAGDPNVDPAEIEMAVEEQARATVDMLTSQNIMLEDGAELTAALQFMNGQLVLNGNPIPLPLEMLLGGH